MGSHGNLVLELIINTSKDLTLPTTNAMDAHVVDTDALNVGTVDTNAMNNIGVDDATYLPMFFSLMIRCGTNMAECPSSYTCRCG